MKKTALQEVFSELEKLQPHLFNVYSTEGREFVNHFHKYLVIEKQQIIDAQSYAISHADMTDNKGYFDCEKYYNETFKQD